MENHGVAGDAGLRRSPFLVTYWEHGSHVTYNYLTRVEGPCSPLVTAILDAATDWTTRAALARAAAAWNDADVERTIDELVADGTLDASDRPSHPDEGALQRWDAWNPAAGFFHAVTSGRRPPDPAEVASTPRPLLVQHDYPAMLKQYSAQPSVLLPEPARESDLAKTLWRRRTWREFGGRELTRSELATVLGLTFGVERWFDIGDDRWVPLKSSPSGGARHSIEAYVLAARVEGIEPGTYHYDPDAHALSSIAGEPPRRAFGRFFGRSPGAHDPAALVVMTAVFERVQWKYHHPHAYRVVHLDAGHLSQTFALVATSLDLAPFCTAAVDTQAIEHHLGIDGIGESVVLALGVGPKPPGKTWAPLPDQSEPPRTRPPQWATRFEAPAFP